ncbi:NUDIX domain-containing protein [Cellulomonas marina]|uniref:Predicted NTP pyrophosphohydrolase, NUDIX family n=1 Tax=Cellulomonas marina TaxID=988821 RepID=A0A1I0W458_9CELL|nr:NUDIX domain-containing protein [Cellulomonas marina]GIG29949.1 DNA mismatch repair protein MutT [Cellulomonas marina]SFA82853.1 Predicted NTP pyrophosphohydrolase, NUDIX family [Cellulomonas marina]
MPTTSAGILLHRRRSGVLEVLVAHMGGPMWRRRQERAWTAPKGEIEPGEDAETAARREFTEELGLPVPDVPLHDLGAFRYRSGKVVVLLTGEADLDVTTIVPGRTTIEWPPRSGRRLEVPEVDEARWVDAGTARRLLVAGQAPAVDALEAAVGA